MATQPASSASASASGPGYRMAQYKQLGSSGLRVSVPVLGCMSYGSSKWQDWVLDEDEALPILKAAYDRGITTWDTANIYSNGDSERVIAKALKKYNIPRSHILILTKCNGLVRANNEKETLALENPESRPEYMNQMGLSRAAIFNAVDASLARLETEYIDMLQIHRFDSKVKGEETMKALHDLVQSGKVRYIGASSMHTYQFATLQHIADKNAWTKFTSMQNHISLLYREEEREMNRYCNETGVGLIPWSPLSFGVLARPFEKSAATVRGERVKGLNLLEGAGEEIVRAVEKVAADRGVPMSLVALAWVGKRVCSPIVGANKIERLDDAIAASYLELSEEEEKAVEGPYKPRAVWGHS